MALVQSRVAVVTPPKYEAIAFASPDDSRRDRIAKLRNTLRSTWATHRDANFVSHHASVAFYALDLVRDRRHTVHFQGPWADEAAIEGAPRWKTWLQRRQERRVYRAADQIITLSTAFKDLVVRQYGVDADRVVVVPGAIDSLAADPGCSRADARQRLEWPQDRRIVLSVRRLVRRVGVLELVEAADAVRRWHPDVLFLIGGTGPLRDELAQRIDALGLADHVRLLGFVADEDLQFAYRAADYSIVPTQALEGFGLVTLESMAAGTPAIVTPVGSLPEVIAPLSESLVLPGKAAGEIAEGLNAILSGGATVPGEHQCRDYVRKNFDWSVIAPKVLDVYRGIAFQ